MFGWVWLLLVLGIALTVIYTVISLYSRSVRVERLERQWDEAPPSTDPEARRRFIADGLVTYRQSLRRRLILLVYVVPLVFIGIVIWVINY